jgi:hypothetical protein
MEQLFKKVKTAATLLPPLPKQVHLCIPAAIIPLKIKGLDSGFDSHHPLQFNNPGISNEIHGTL